MRIIATLMLSLVVSYGMSSATAANAIPDYYSESGPKSNRELSVDIQGSERIDPFNGMLQLQYTDLVLPGVNGLDINFTRIYRAISPKGTMSLPPDEFYRTHRSTVGLGWDMHFGRFYSGTALTNFGCTIDTNLHPTAENNPVLELPDGSRQVFFIPAQPSTEVPYPLISKERWVAECIVGSAAGGMRVKSTSGMIYTFDWSGAAIPDDGNIHSITWVITRLEDPHGNYLDFHYTNMDSGDLFAYAYLDKITASDGQAVTLTYEGIDTPLAVLKSVETTEQRWEYFYQPLANEVLPGFEYLDKVVGPEGLTWGYAYYANEPIQNNSSVGAKHMMQTVTAPYGGVTNYTYQAVDLGAFPSIPFYSIAIQTKELTGPGIETGQWQYQFYKNYPESPYDFTDVIGPQGKTTYTHCGMLALQIQNTEGEIFQDGALGDCNAKEGTLLRKRTYQLDGTLVQEERNEWGLLLLSTQKEKRPSRTYFSQDNTYVTILQQTIINRDGLDYVSSYYNVNVYGQSEYLLEYSGTSMAYGEYPEHTTNTNLTKRDTEYTHHLDTAHWILKQNSEYVYDFHDHGGNQQQYSMTTGELQQQTNYGYTSHFDYHANGELLRTTDALGQITEFKNYYRGISQEESQLMDLSDPNDDIIITRVVNPDGTVQTQTNGRQKTTTYTYDDLNRVISINLPRIEDQSIIIDWDYATRSRTITRGNFVNVETYDGLGRIVRSQSNDVLRTYRYNTAGQKIFESNPNSTVGTAYQWDALDRLVQMTHTVDGHFIHYTYTANQVTIKNERDIETVTTYRAFGSPETRSLIRITVAEGVETLVERTQSDEILAIEQGGKRRDYQYDEHYQLDYSFHPETGKHDVIINAAGNKTEEKREATNTSGDIITKITTYNYDSGNRLKKIDYPGTTPDIEYAYDNNNNLLTLSAGGSQWQYQYDDNDNLTHETLNIDTQQFDLEYRYNTLDALSRVIYPNLLEVDYAPDSKGWPQRVGDYIPTPTDPNAKAITYHPNGQIKALRYANGQHLTITQNPRLFPETIKVEKPNTQNIISNMRYIYDPIGNTTDIIDSIQPQYTRTLIYDNLDRLDTASGVWGSGNIDYNTFGNIIDKVIGSTAVQYNYNGGQTKLSGITGTHQRNYSYDIYGNVKTDGSNQYQYNDASNMTIALSGNVIHYYDYDGYHRRVKDRSSDSRITNDPETILYTLYNHEGQLLYELEKPSGKTRSYIHLNGQQIARQDINPDADDDGIPDGIELESGYPIDDPNDALLDVDQDNLNRLQEYQNGTSDNNADTDQDGIPDGFEVQHQLDPLKNDAADDLDQDGSSNLEEFQGGTDPNDNSSYPGSDSGTGTSALLWQINVNTNHSTAVAPNGDLYLVQADGLYAYNADGNEQWIHVGSYQTTPTIAGDGTLYLSGDTLQALSPEGNLQWETKPITLQGLAIAPDSTIHTGFRAYNPDGTQQWRNKTVTTEVAIAPVIGSDGTLYVVDQLGQINALDKEGTIQWQYPTNHPANQNSLVIGPEGTLYLTQDDNGGSIITALQSDGQLRWQKHLPTAISNLVIDLQGILYHTYTNGLNAWTAAGDLVWQQDLGSNASTSLALGKQRYLVVDNQVVSVDAQGQAQTLYTFNQTVSDATLTIANDRLYVLTDSQLTALTIEPATQPWSMSGHDARNTKDVNPLEIRITAPTIRTMEPDTITLSAWAMDDESGEISDLIQWNSNLDGSLGTGSTISSLLSMGKHNVTATVATPTNQASVQRKLHISTVGTVTLSTDLASPQAMGIIVTIQTSTTGNGVYEYKFSIKGDATNDEWQDLQDYSPSKTVIWDTSMYPGTYKLRVKVRVDSTDKPVVAKSKYTVLPPPVDQVTLEATPTEPQPPGTSVTITSQATGGLGEYDYHFSIKGPATGDTWEILQTYSTNNSITWDSTGYDGKNKLRVKARNAGIKEKAVVKKIRYRVQ